MVIHVLFWLLKNLLIVCQFLVACQKLTAPNISRDSKQAKLENLTKFHETRIHVRVPVARKPKIFEMLYPRSGRNQNSRIAKGKITIADSCSQMNHHNQPKESFKILDEKR